MKDYSNWEPFLDYENESPYLENPDRQWIKFRPDYIPKSIKFEPIPLHEYLKLRITKFLNNVCVYYKPEEKNYTYRDLVYISEKIANALYEIGVKKGDSVGIMANNCPEFLFCCLGVLEIGAILIPINPLLKEADVTHIITDAGNMNTIFVHKNNFRTIRKVKKDFELKNVILIGSEEPKPDTITIHEFLKKKVPKHPEIDIDPMKDIAVLLYTGGTTGLPKGVMLTHNNIIATSLSSLYGLKERDVEIDDVLGKRVFLSVLPLCHSFGFQILISSLVMVSMLVIFDSFNVSDVLDAIEYFKPPLFIGVPVMFQMLINSPGFKERDLSSLESAISGSAALSPELNKRWEEVVGFKVGQGFGLTETSAISHMRPTWLPKIIPESIGIPLIDTDVKIVNPDTLEELSPGEIGEILIKGPQIMKGYWKKPEETANTIINGWLRTGDLARMDINGYFYIEGRTKDIIKYKGYKIMPKEIEEKLCQHPAVLEVGVVSAPDPEIGETIKAYITIKPDYQGKVTENHIIEWSKERMAPYKYPRKVEFVNILPRTAVGKIFRRKLRERALKDY
ncbi:MAG: class I adenylate-forming enzyme family protein [Promethearchaeota archaeon]